MVSMKPGMDAFDGGPRGSRKGEGMSAATLAPEDRIKRYLDAEGGEAVATVRHLLMTFQIEADDAQGRGRIANALASGGVGVRPQLHGLADDESVVLSAMAEEDVARYWAEEQGASYW